MFPNPVMWFFFKGAKKYSSKGRQKASKISVLCSEVRLGLKANLQENGSKLKHFCCLLYTDFFLTIAWVYSHYRASIRAYSFNPRKLNELQDNNESPALDSIFSRHKESEILLCSLKTVTGAEVKVIQLIL